MNKRIILFSSLIAAATTAPACSVCIAHAIGAALHGIGAQTLEKGTKVISIGFLGFDKTNASTMPGQLEHEHFRESTVDVLYGLTNQTTLTASIPYVFKTIDGTHSTGLGDASVGFLQQLPPKTKDKVLIAFNGSMKFATGANNMKDSGGALRDEHEQLGTGSTDLSLGVSFTAEGPQRSLLFAGLSGRWNGKNTRDYHYGNAFFYDLGFSHPLDVGSAFVVELNGRLTAKDTDAGVKDDESGGHLMYLSLSYRRSLGGGMGLIGSIEQPVLSRLNGSQHEGAVISISLARMF